MVEQLVLITPRVTKKQRSDIEKLATFLGHKSVNKFIFSMIDQEMEANRDKLEGWGISWPAKQVDVWLSSPVGIGDYECQIIGDTMIHETDVRFVNDKDDSDGLCCFIAGAYWTEHDFKQARWRQK